MAQNNKTRYIVEKLSRSGIWQQVDPELIPLVSEINAHPGITSDVCCSGHGTYFPYVCFLIDGSMESLKSLAALAEGFKASGWFVSCQTISGDGTMNLYFVAIPFEALSAIDNTGSFIKVPLGDVGSGYDFEDIADRIRKKMRRTGFGLRRPLFPVPEEGEIQMKEENMLNVRILGAGGCLNKGMPYNSFLINTDFLVELPPDVMPSLKKQQVDLLKINTVFVSHQHGDHTFGFPFFVINYWLEAKGSTPECKIRMLGPGNIKKHMFQLLDAAFSSAHPCFQWAENNMEFKEIDLSEVEPYDSFALKFFHVEHMTETIGFSAMKDRVNLLTYIPDTRWCPKVEEVLMERPLHVIMDMNGGNPQVHLSRDDVEKKGLEITGDVTRYYGIHLNEYFESSSDKITCLHEGDEFLCRIPTTDCGSSFQARQ